MTSPADTAKAVVRLVNQLVNKCYQLHFMHTRPFYRYCKSNIKREQIIYFTACNWVKQRV